MIFKKRLFIIITAILFAVVTSMTGCGNKDSGEQTTNTPDKVVFQLNWLPEEPVYWAALEKGFWQEQNLDVEIIRGYGSTDAITKMATKKADIGQADLGAVIMAKAKEDIKVKAVANYETSFPAVIMYNSSQGIKVPKDLEGKTIVSSATSSMKLFWPAFARAVGIDQNKVEWKLVDPALQQPAFVRGEVDAWTTDFDSIADVEEITGAPATYFSYRDDGGIDRYGISLIVHEDTITNNPDLIRRFVAGYLKGVKYCIENPSEVGAIVTKYVPEIDAELAVENWQITLKNRVVISDESYTYGLGWMSKDVMTETVDLVLKAYDLPINIAPELVYTTEFLPEKPEIPAKK